MKVRTLRKHLNSYPPQTVKNVGRKYEISENVGKNLVALGIVVEAEPARE